MELEAGGVAVINRHAEDIRRQEVAGELHAAEFQPQHLRQRVGQCGLAHPGQVFDQQVTACQNAGEGQPDLGLFAEDDGTAEGDDVFKLDLDHKSWNGLFEGLKVFFFIT